MPNLFSLALTIAEIFAFKQTWYTHSGEFYEGYKNIIARTVD